MRQAQTFVLQHFWHRQDNNSNISFGTPLKMLHSGWRSLSVITPKLSRRHSSKYSTDKLSFSNAMLMRQDWQQFFSWYTFPGKKACSSNHLYQHLLIYFRTKDKQTWWILLHKPPANLDSEGHQTVKSPSNHRDYLSALSMLSSFQSRKNCWQKYTQL